jgi:anti-sigma B factor antagonist
MKVVQVMETTVVVRLVGDFDAYNRDELRRLLQPALEQPDVVIDFSATRYIDSSCLTELANLRRSRLGAGLPAVRLVISNRNIRKIFQIVGFDQVFPVYESLHDATHQPTC